MELALREEILQQGISEFLKTVKNWDFFHDDRQRALNLNNLASLYETGLMSIFIPESVGGLDCTIKDFVNTISHVAWFDISLALAIADHSLACYILKELNCPLATKKLEEVYVARIFLGISRWGDTVDAEKSVSDSTSDNFYQKRIALSHNLNRYEINFSVSINDPLCYSVEKLTSLESVTSMNTTGLRALRIGDVKFSEKEKLGDINDIQFSRLQSMSQLSISAIAFGASMRQIRTALDYGTQRNQFKRKLGDFEIIKQKQLKMHCGALLIHYMRAWQRESHENDSLSTIVSYLALICTKIAAGITEQSMQICGGNGYMEDMQIPRFVRDTRSLSLLVNKDYSLPVLKEQFKLLSAGLVNRSNFYEGEDETLHTVRLKSIAVLEEKYHSDDRWFDNLLCVTIAGVMVSNLVPQFDKKQLNALNYNLFQCLGSVILSSGRVVPFI